MGIENRLESYEALLTRVPDSLREGFTREQIKEALTQAIKLVEENPSDPLILVKQGVEPFLFPIPSGLTIESVFDEWDALIRDPNFFSPIGRYYANNESNPRRTAIHRFWVGHLMAQDIDIAKVLDLMVCFHAHPAPRIRCLSSLFDVLNVRIYPARISEEGMNEFDAIARWAKANSLEKELDKFMFSSQGSIGSHVRTLVHTLLFKIREDGKKSVVPEDTTLSRFINGTLNRVLTTIFYFCETGQWQQAKDDVNFLKSYLPHSYLAFVSHLHARQRSNEWLSAFRVSYEDMVKAQAAFPRPYAPPVKMMKDIRSLDADVNKWLGPSSGNRRSRRRKKSVARTGGAYNLWKERDEQYSHLPTVERGKLFVRSYNAANKLQAQKIADQYLEDLFTDERKSAATLIYSLANLAKERPAFKAQILAHMRRENVLHVICNIASSGMIHLSAGALYLLAEYCKQDSSGEALPLAITHILSSASPVQHSKFNYVSCRVHRRLFSFLFLVGDFSETYPVLLRVLAESDFLLSEAPEEALSEHLAEKMYMLTDFDLSHVEVCEEVSDLELPVNFDVSNAAAEIIDKRDVSVPEFIPLSLVGTSLHRDLGVEMISRESEPGTYAFDLKLILDTDSVPFTVSCEVSNPTNPRVDITSDLLLAAPLAKRLANAMIYLVHRYVVRQIKDDSREKNSDLTSIVESSLTSKSERGPRHDSLLAHVDVDALARRHDAALNRAIQRNSGLVAALINGENVPVDDLKVYLKGRDGVLREVSKEEIWDRQSKKTLLDMPAILCQTKAAHGKKMPLMARRRKSGMIDIKYHKPSTSAQRAKAIHDEGALPSLGRFALAPTSSVIALHFHSKADSRSVSSSDEDDSVDAAKLHVDSGLEVIKELHTVTSSRAWKLSHVEREIKYTTEKLAHLINANESTTSTIIERDEWERLHAAITNYSEDTVELTRGGRPYVYWLSQQRSEIVDDEHVVVCSDTYSQRPKTFVSASMRTLAEIADEITSA